MTKKFLLSLLLTSTILFSLGAKAEQVTADFNNGLPEGWTTVGSITNNADRAKSGKGLWSSDKKDDLNYIITTEMEGDVSFFARTYNTKSYGYVIFYKLNSDDSLGDKIIEFSTGNNSSSPIPWKEYKHTLPTSMRIAIALNYACIDDFTYTPAEAAAGPRLAVENFTSGDTFNFGGVPVPESTEAQFNLTNTGGSVLTVSSVTVTGDFILSDVETPLEIEPGEVVGITVSTPAKNATGVLSIVSDDDESPYTINLESEYKVPAPVMVLGSSSIDFGRVTAGSSLTLEVSNTGDAPLHVTAASSSPLFTVSPESLEVDPEESDIFTITFLYADAEFKEYEAVLSLTPEGEEAVTVNLSAKAADPEEWVEDFEGGEMPSYWTTTGWTVTIPNYYEGGNDTYMAFAGNSDPTLTLTTPRLYAKEGQSLSFDVGNGTDSKDILTIEYSHDLSDWQPMSGSPLTAGGTYTFTAPEDGYYYLKFNGKYGAVDNFCGFRLAPKTHDVAITGLSIPSKALQYVEYSVSVKVKEVMDLPEDIEAVLYFNEEAVARVSDSLQASEEKTLALSFTPSEGVEDAKVYVTINYAETESLSSSPVTVSVETAPVWDEEDADTVFEDGILPVLVLNYKPTPGWNTITVPFELNDTYLSEIFGDNCMAFELKGFDGKQITFQTPLRYAAGYPYVVYVKSESTEVSAASEDTEGIVLKDVRISRTSPQYDMQDGVSFIGTYSPITGDASGKMYMIGSDKRIKSMGADDRLSGFRAYLTLPANISNVPTLRFLDGNGVETGITAISDSAEPTNAIFNLQGQMIKGIPAPGIYIVNGKKTVLK